MGFTAASIIFDVLSRLIGYESCLEKPILSVTSLLSISVVSTAVAGFMIGGLFMNPKFLAATFGGTALFAGLHAAGGAVEGIIGFILIKALSTRILIPKKFAIGDRR